MSKRSSNKIRKNSRKTKHSKKGGQKGGSKRSSKKNRKTSRKSKRSQKGGKARSLSGIFKGATATKPIPTGNGVCSLNGIFTGKTVKEPIALCGEDFASNKMSRIAEAAGFNQQEYTQFGGEDQLRRHLSSTQGGLPIVIPDSVITALNSMKDNNQLTLYRR